MGDDAPEDLMLGLSDAHIESPFLEYNRDCLSSDTRRDPEAHARIDPRGARPKRRAAPRWPIPHEAHARGDEWNPTWRTPVTTAEAHARIPLWRTPAMTCRGARPQ